MVPDNHAFFGAVLKAIACTRNYNEDTAAYAAGVLVPATRIRELEQEVGERRLTGDEVQQVLDWLEQTFDTKRTPEEEREHYRRLVNQAGGLHEAGGVPATAQAAEVTMAEAAV